MPPRTWAAGRLWLQAHEPEFGNLFRIFVHCYLPTIFLSVQSMLFPRVLTLTVTVETRRDSGSSVVLHLCAWGVFVLSDVQLLLPWKNKPKITNLWNETGSWLKRARWPSPAAPASAVCLPIWPSGEPGSSGGQRSSPLSTSVPSVGSTTMDGSLLVSFGNLSWVSGKIFWRLM